MTQRWKQRPARSNWGDFGPDDELGRLNLITPEVVLKALAKEGRAKFLLTAPPLRLPGAVGSPVTPVATL